MAQVNSGIGTKACTYDFGLNGALGANVFSFSGIAMKPGEVILDIKVTKFDNFTAGGAGTFSLGWGPNTAGGPGVAFVPFWSDTIANINTYIFYLYKGAGTTTTYDQASNPRLPATLSISTSMWFTSSIALTGGRCAFYVTYGYAKF